MEIIRHRRNTIEQLVSTPTRYGVEVDIRSYGNRLVIHHDPFVEGEPFDKWLKAYQHGTLVLNVKEEGLEERVAALMRKYGVEEYFFLDQSFPFLIRSIMVGQHRCAVRVSEFESIQTALSLSRKVDWVWVDCFTHFPLGYDEVKQLQSSGFRLCLVSPELQGRNAEQEVSKLIELLNSQGIIADAVCTKRPDLWEASDLP